MKSSVKTLLTVLTAAIILNASCKKNDSASSASDNTAAISKQLALDLYHSLSSGVSTSSNSGLKTGSTSSLKTMDSQNPCGQAVTTTTNRSAVNGDTTRTYVGNSIFTYMCNGFFNDNYTVDAYTLKDTLTTTEKGTGFKNIYGVTLNYTVKATDANYTQLSINGYTNTSSFVSKVSGNTTTESHLMVTGYLWTQITAKRTANVNPDFLSGKVDFDTHLEDKDAAGKSTTNGYSGFMEFLPNNMIRSTFYVLGGANKVYLINVLTGQVTAV
jgi:hypothetical protein